MQYNITYRQKDKGWQYIISYKDNGIWKQKSKQGFDTRKKAALAASERVKELEKQLALEDILDAGQKEITFLEFANQLIEHEKLYKEYRTILTSYTAVKHFEKLYNMAIKDIKHIHIQNCIDTLAMAGYKITTIKLQVTIIKYIFNQAVEPHKIILNNPIGKIKYPSESLEEQNKKIKALTKSETEMLLAKLKEHNEAYYMISLLAVTTGLRVGELLGLTWSDIDFQNAVVNVNKQWKLLANGDSGFGKLKRKIPIEKFPSLQKRFQN